MEDADASTGDLRPCAPRGEVPGGPGRKQTHSHPITRTHLITAVTPMCQVLFSFFIFDVPPSSWPRRIGAASSSCAVPNEVICRHSHAPHSSISPCVGRFSAEIVLSC